MPPNKDEAMASGEIERTLERIEATMLSGFAQIRADMSSYVLKAVHDAEMSAVRTRVEEVARESQNDLLRIAQDHEMRLRGQEARKVISPASLWSAVGVLMGGMAALAAIYWVVADLIPRFNV